MKSWIKGVLIVSIIFISLIRIVSAADFNEVISNSEDWKDVFSSMLYANLVGVDSNFLVSTAHGPLLLNGISKNNNILVVTSNKKPYVFNYPDMIRSRGYAGVSEITSDNINIRLIQELPDIKNFIVVGDSYGFNAIAVSPYSVITKSWVFFANRGNIAQIDSIMTSRNPQKVIIYGYVDPEVRNTLTKYSPEIIDNQDRFKDNIEIVKKFIAIKPTKQVVFTNGEFIEKEIMGGVEPSLFTGKDNVPEEISTYLKSSGIEVGVLIGNDLVGAATNIRRTTGVNVMVKFARGARSQTGGVAAVEGLDLFPIPSPNLILGITSIKLDRGTKKLYVTYKSDSNVQGFLSGTLTLSSGVETYKTGEKNGPVFIAPGEYKTMIYDISDASSTLLNSDFIKADFYTLFGETKSSLDRVLQGSVNVSIVTVLDNCKINPEDIQSVKYNKQKKAFVIKIKNSNSVDCWYSLEMQNIAAGYIFMTLTPEKGIQILSGKTGNIEIKQDQSNEDLDKNQLVEMTVYSGEKEDSLVNSYTGKFTLSIESLTVLAYATIAIAVIIIIMIFIIFLIKRRKDDDD